MKSRILNLNIGLFVILTLFSRTSLAASLKTSEEEFGYASEYSLNTGFIVIKSNPSGAEVYISGKTTGKKTPFQMQLEAGDYKFTLQYETYHTFEGEFTIQKGQTITKEVVLKPAYGNIKIISEPSGADIILDGVVLNKKTPITLLNIPSGLHNISLSKEMYSDKVEKLTVNDELTTELFLELQAGYGTVGIVAKPDATIRINGNSVGTGNYVGRLPQNKHVIEITRENYYPQKREISVEAGQEYKFNFELKPVTGSISVMVEPAETEIYLNGKNYGLSPRFITDLMTGTYNLELKKSSFLDLKEEIKIDENKTTEINETLSKGIVTQILTNPPSAEILVNGKSAGTTPFSQRYYPGTNLKIELQKKYFESYATSINVRKDSTYQFSLKQRFQDISILSTPSGAVCIINGEDRGLTPVKTKVAMGDNKLSLLKKEYLNLDKTVEVNESNRDFNYTLSLDHNLEIKRQIAKKKVLMWGSLITAGGAFGMSLKYLSSSNSNYEKYKTATTEATALHSAVKTDTRNMILCASGGTVASVFAIIFKAKANNLKKQIRYSGYIVPGNQANIYLTYNF